MKKNTNRLFAALLLVSVLVFTNSSIAAAYDINFYSNNDILYYDPTAQNTCDTSSSAIQLGGKTNLEKIYNYFAVTKSMSPISAAGIVGNISLESGGYPMRKQGTPSSQEYPDPSNISAGWGIIQWTPGSKIIGIAKDAGITGPINELATQLEIVYWHMNNTSPTGVRDMYSTYKDFTDVAAATTDYMNRMEAPAASTNHLADRIAAAKLALDQFGGTASTSSGDNLNTSAVLDCGAVGGSAVAGNAVKTAIGYAWPTYHAAPFTTPTASYAKAVAAAQSKGLFVGGGINPGIDCGGFVTRVMQDSGVDTDYNRKPAGGTTNQLSYVRSSGKYEELKNPTTASMQPGDIAINGEHTYMYVGKNTGFETSIASASYSTTGRSWRAPMSGHELPADPDFSWFRLKGSAS